MKSRIGYACVCAILMLIASPALLGNTWSVPSGDHGSYGNASANHDDSGGSWCSATAHSDGSDPSSGAVAWASLDYYTDTAGSFYVSGDCSASGGASYYDAYGTGASGSGGGSSSCPWGSASANFSFSSGGEPGGDGGGDYDPGVSGTDWVYLDAYGSVSASSSCGAYTSVSGSPNTADGNGGASASVSM